VLVENRHGLTAAAMTTQADGTAERKAALHLLNALQEHAVHASLWEQTKATNDFVSTVRELRVTPHVRQNQQPAQRD